MTTFTSEDRSNVLPKVGSRWQGANSQEEFTIVAVWNPNEEPDPWARYVNQAGNEYTCRLEAFLARFTKLPDER
jgi:hypothetical protein